MNKILSIFIALACVSHDLLADPQQPGATNRVARSRSATESAQHNSINLVEFDKQVARAADNLKQMQQQMDLIQQAKEVQERLRLLHEHWTTLQAAMGNLRNMWAPGLMGCCGSVPPAEERITTRIMGGPMMGGMMNWHSAGGYYSSLTPDQLKQRQYMADQYLALQHQVLGHMLQHQHWVQQSQSSPPARAR